MPQEIDEVLPTEEAEVEVEEEVVPDQGGGTAPPTTDNGKDKWFLTVDDRTRYRTQEDAVRGIQESGRRIGELSRWEKELGESYGITDPAVVRQLLDELVEARESLKEVPTLKQQLEQLKGNQEKGKNTFTDDDEALSADEKSALKWLQKANKNLGYVPKTELETTVNELKAQLAELQTGRSEQQEMQRQATVSEGRARISEWMKDLNVQDDADGTKAMTIENGVSAWINRDRQRVQTFVMGGEPAMRMVKQGFELVTKAFGIEKKPAVATAAATIRNKQAAIVRNGQRLPQPGLPGRKPSETARPANGKPRDYIGEAHDKAWEAVQNARKGQ